MTEDDVQTQPAATIVAHGGSPRIVALSPDRDRYAMGEQLGRGGMGEVRLAHDVRIDRDVAVKLMRPDMRDDASTMRFFREARIQGRLDHPAIPPVYDLGVDEQGTPYFVMKRLTGTTLHDVLAGHPDAAKWPRRQLLAKLVDVCLAVAFAHTRDIVHRDLKPSNIMLGDFGEVYVLDWGLARVVDGSRLAAPISSVQPHAGETAAGAVLGTPGYMAPEQLRDPAVDSRADVYALGCILYEIATGAPALPRGMAALEDTLAARAHRPSDRHADVPPELDDLCARATAADPAQRPTAREIADGVQAYLDGDRDLARRRELAAQHAGRAVAATARDDEEARAEAIREAGRALSLDAANAEAQAVLGRVLLDAPREVPQAARAGIERDRAETRQIVLRSLGWAYTGVTAMYLGTLWFPIHHPWVIVASAGMCAAAGLRAWSGARKPTFSRSPAIAQLLWLNAATLASVSVVFGPLLVTPVFLVASLAIALMQPSGFGWKLPVATQTLGIVAPLVLEWLGVLPSTYHVSADGLVLTPWVVTLSPIPTIVLLLGAIGSQITIASVVALTRSRAQQDAEDRLYTMRWHLEQLLPRRKD